MSCERWQPEISAWLDGALSERAEADLRRHLATCTTCSRSLAVHRKLYEAIIDQPSLTPPPQIWQRIEAQLAQRPRVEAKPVRLARFWDWLTVPNWAYAAASLVLLVLSGLTAVRMQFPDPSATETWLTELESFDIQASGNPFMDPVEGGNPFFNPNETERNNPFKGRGELR